VVGWGAPTKSRNERLFFASAGAPLPTTKSMRSSVFT